MNRGLANLVTLDEIRRFDKTVDAEMTMLNFLFLKFYKAEEKAAKYGIAKKRLGGFLETYGQWLEQASYYEDVDLTRELTIRCNKICMFIQSSRRVD